MFYLCVEMEEVNNNIENNEEYLSTRSIKARLYPDEVDDEEAYIFNENLLCDARYLTRYKKSGSQNASAQTDNYYLPFTRLDENFLRFPSSLVVVGMRGEGKTSLVNFYLRKLFAEGCVDDIYIMTSFPHQYKNVMSPLQCQKRIFTTGQEEEFAKVIDDFIYNRAQMLEKKEINIKELNHIIVVLDDVFKKDKDLSKSVEKMYQMGKNVLVTPIIVNHRIINMMGDAKHNRMILQNTEVFVTKTLPPKELETLYECLGDCIKSERSKTEARRYFPDFYKQNLEHRMLKTRENTFIDKNKLDSSFQVFIAFRRLLAGSQKRHDMHIVAGELWKNDQEYIEFKQKLAERQQAWESMYRMQNNKPQGTIGSGGTGVEVELLRNITNGTNVMMGLAPRQNYGNLSSNYLHRLINCTFNGTKEKTKKANKKKKTKNSNEPQQVPSVSGFSTSSSSLPVRSFSRQRRELLDVLPENRNKRRREDDLSESRNKRTRQQPVSTSSTRTSTTTTARPTRTTAPPVYAMNREALPEFLRSRHQ